MTQRVTDPQCDPWRWGWDNAGEPRLQYESVILAL
jgi:hypothetical protein